MAHQETIAVFGAGGKTGSEAVKQVARRGFRVIGLEHHLPAMSERIEDVEYVQCDVLEDDLAGKIEGCGAVISALGVSFSPKAAIDPPPLYTEGTRRIVEAMQQTNITRIAVISAAFVEPQPSVPIWFRHTVVPALVNILENMRAMEHMLEAQRDLRWTAVRPGWLIDLPFSGEARTGPLKLPDDCFRCRHTDLAAFLVDIIEKDEWIKAKPAIGKPETDDREGLAALRKELESIFASNN